MRYLLLFVLASACLNHDSKTNTTTGSDSIETPQLATSVADGKLQVKVAGYEVLLFEINDRLLFSRLVLKKTDKQEVCVMNSASRVIVADDEIYDEKCYADAANIEKFSAFISACIELEQTGKQYRLGIYGTDSISVKCGRDDGEVGDNTAIYMNWIPENAKLPTGYEFAAKSITAANIEKVVNNARICKEGAKLSMHPGKEFLCSCKAGDSLNGGNELMQLFNGDSGQPTCSEDREVNLLTPLAVDKTAG